MVYRQGQEPRQLSCRREVLNSILIEIKRLEKFKGSLETNFDNKNDALKKHHGGQV